MKYLVTNLSNKYVNFLKLINILNFNKINIKPHIANFHFCIYSSLFQPSQYPFYNLLCFSRDHSKVLSLIYIFYGSFLELTVSLCCNVDRISVQVFCQNYSKFHCLIVCELLKLERMIILEIFELKVIMLIYVFVHQHGSSIFA